MYFINGQVRKPLKQTFKMGRSELKTLLLFSPGKGLIVNPPLQIADPTDSNRVRMKRAKKQKCMFWVNPRYQTCMEVDKKHEITDHDNVYNVDGAAYMQRFIDAGPCVYVYEGAPRAHVCVCTGDGACLQYLRVNIFSIIRARCPTVGTQ